MSRTNMEVEKGREMIRRVEKKRAITNHKVRWKQANRKETTDNLEDVVKFHHISAKEDKNLNLLDKFRNLDKRV